MNFPRIYLSGFRAVLKEHGGKDLQYEYKWLKRARVRYRCMNFAYVWKGAFGYQEKIAMMYRACLVKNVHVMMDSSAFTFFMFIRKMQGKVSSSKKAMSPEEFDRLRDETIDEYVKFVNQDGKLWDFYANFDYLKDCDVIRKMQIQLEKRGLKPAPVYHGDKSLDYLKWYCDRGYPIICIGMYPKARRGYEMKTKWFEKLFRTVEPYGTKLHAFGITDLASLQGFPWYSTDSATWAKTAAFGMICFPDQEKNIIRSMHVSVKGSNTPNSYNRFSKSVQRTIEDFVESRGFDFDKIRTSVYERCTFNAYVFQNLDELIDLRQTRAEWEQLITL